MAKKKAAKKVAKLGTPANTRMSVRIPGTLAEDLDKLSNLPVGTALVVAARIGLIHAPKQLKSALEAVAAARIGEAA